MKGFLPLLKKEILEQLRTHKLLIVGGIFLFFGLTTPLTLKYLPEILKLAGDQMVIEFPEPTAFQALAEYVGTIGQIGVLIAVLLTMGAVANELRHNTAYMVLSKPVSYFSFTTTKLIASSLTFVISLSITSLFTFGYTVWLIEGTSFGPFVLTNLLTALFLIFCLAVTILFSSLFKSSLAAGGISIGFIIAFSALSAIPVLGKYTPGKLLTWGIDLMAGRGEPYWWSLAISLTIIALCLYLAPKFLKHKEM